jgi:CheY-like chemotaxis protein
MSNGDRTLMGELAHELRDALSPLASAADLARLRHYDPEVSRLLAEKVERGLRRALKILDAFVLADQSERDALRLALQVVPLDEIVRAACNELAQEEAARCQVIPGGQAAQVSADAAWSAQVLTAVLQHAGASAPRGRVVEVRSLGGVEPQIRVRCGVDTANRPGQESFAGYRAGNARMALRTARRIMRSQGGGLELLRGGDEECEFVLRFAAARAQPEAQRQQAAPQRVQAPRPRATGNTERILIVDDSYEVRRAYREALVTLGYTVLEAADAEQALSALESTIPDVALIDIHLPRMNGYRLAQTIRARMGRGIYLVMLSGMALDGVTRALAQEAGFDDCLDKMAGPLALRELIASSSERNSLGNVER